MTINPLVAGSLDQPASAWSGIWIAEDIELIAQGIKAGSWIDGTLGVVGVGLDGLALVSDPIGALLQYGISWLIEHVRPLTEALDWLAGDPGQIAGHAQTWRNIAKSLHGDAEQLRAEAATTAATWTGTAGDTYRSWAQQQHDAILGIAKAAGAMASITEGAGALIAAVRILVRDAIATAVSRLIVYAAELVASWGTATPLVVEQVTTLVASWGAKIARWLRALIASLRRLGPIVTRLGDLTFELQKILRRLRGQGHLPQGPSHTKPSHAPNATARPRGTPAKAHPTKNRDLAKRRENEAADVLARDGYDVEQNPPPRENGKEPDYKIEGEYFDCYSPTTNDLDNLRDGISKKLRDKLGKLQADRIVLNLDDSPFTADQIRDILIRKPIEGLKEIIIVRGGASMPFFPFM
ncbi:hypothetical protein AB0H43_13905 [Hamadaea sp. NPDC050747]|uniref:CdiA C-terminal domain-containing protein n=1 Tax=Hamadaea sp. NPDC050747 TaxID=3155789 RepID=UPI0034018F4C